MKNFLSKELFAPNFFRKMPQNEFSKGGLFSCRGSQSSPSWRLEFQTHTDWTLRHPCPATMSHDLQFELKRWSLSFCLQPIIYCCGCVLAAFDSCSISPFLLHMCGGFSMICDCHIDRAGLTMHLFSSTGCHWTSSEQLPVSRVSHFFFPTSQLFTSCVVFRNGDPGSLLCTNITIARICVFQ